MTTVPDFMPVLGTHAHDGPEDGACLLEYISVLAGEKFSDRPNCVDPGLALAGRIVNDMTDDEDRHLLVPLIGRLMGTGGYREGDDDLNDLTHNRLHDLTSEEILTPRRTSEYPCRVAALERMIDEFDVEFGRTTHHELTEPEKELLLTTINQGAHA